ncbi:hypothetical protein [Saccharothrix sp. HUAS TT1]|uniref:hypothetical protein n=1 Tax=unclassified Saccharothrix TaxID=2593673 RepID=UPI00345C0234
MSAERISVEDPIGVLRAAVDATMQAVLRLDPHHEEARAEVDRALTAFAAAVAPVGDRLREAAERAPHGAVAVALGFLRDAGDHVAGGDVQAARVAVLAGRATLFRLASERR